MKLIYVDTLYWIALINPKDQWHTRSMQAKDKLKLVNLITTDLVLVEVLNYYSTYGSRFRQVVSDVIQEILADPQVEVIPHTQDLFQTSLRLYQERLDKGYSLTDCGSMVVTREKQITEILTHDHHFTQEGFVILL